MIEERFDPDRTVLSLSFKKKQAIKASDKKQAIKTSDKKQAKKTAENIEKIRNYLEQSGELKASDMAEYLGLSLPRTRALMNSMESVVAMGGNRNRTYRLKEKSF